MDCFELVVGTKNQKKLGELQRLLAEHPVHVSTLADFPALQEPEETGTTFAENAEIKATYYAQNLGCWVLAEDSGLSVSSLNGNPGVYSARFSGQDATDESNNQLLLEKMATVCSKERGGWYTCHIVIADPTGRVHARSEAECHGQILFEPRGDKGFGYDPLFEIPEYGLTFAQLGESVKSVLSHRAKAYRKLIPQLIALTKLATT